ncbi:MAG: hypothetical protein J6T92_04435 [Ottowia sp.]|nr:hypothetical protein [Ottowia sp.]
MRLPVMSPAARALYDAAMKLADEDGWVQERAFMALPQWSYETDRELFNFAIRRKEWGKSVGDERLLFNFDGLSDKADALYWAALARVDVGGRMCPQEFRALPSWSQKAEEELYRDGALYWNAKRFDRQKQRQVECIQMERPSFERLAAHLRQQEVSHD